ncbi:MAG: ImuA family protein [Xanthobacteraceae bacterium]
MPVIVRSALCGLEPPLPSDTPRLDRSLGTTSASLQLLLKETAAGPRVLTRSSNAVALGIAEIDASLGGGLGCGALHEATASGEATIASATLFALAVAVRTHRSGNAQATFNRAIPDQVLSLVAKKHALWISEDLTSLENGHLYGPGLVEVGIRPEQLIIVAAAHRRDVLWAMEEALRSPAIGVVIGELREHNIDPIVTRRLSLAAAAGHTLGLILRTAPDHQPSAAVTRWVIGPPRSPRFGDRGGVGPPRLALQLVRNRRGHLGAWIVEWNSVEQRFKLTTHSEPVAETTFNRQNRPAVA